MNKNYREILYKPLNYYADLTILSVGLELENSAFADLHKADNMGKRDMNEDLGRQSQGVRYL